MTHSLDELPIFHDWRYQRCLELAREVKSRGGYGAVLEAVFKDGSSMRFEGRSRRKRPGRYASGGFCEHAENVVLNDALDYAARHDTSLKDATMYIAGIENDVPYIYIEPRYSCGMCAAQLRKELPESTEIRVPTADGWQGFSPAEAYESAKRIRYEKRGAPDFRKGNSLLKTSLSTKGI